MEETVFFDQGGISVTNARFLVHGQTYAMSGVTSVKQATNYPSRFVPVLLGLSAVIIMLFGTTAAVVWGLILLAIAILLGISQKPEYVVVLSSSSGESQALKSEDRSLVEGVIAALNNSIIHRG